MSIIGNPIIVRKKSGIIYGFHINSSESDPAAAVTYLEDAIGMTPAYMDFTNDTFVWGSWQNAFFIPRPCMLKYNGTVDYYLDENNYAKKEDGVTNSAIATDSYGGNAMMEWGRDGKKIWYKIVPDRGDATSASIYIADHQADADYHAWSFINSQGVMVDHFYTSIYSASLVTTNSVQRMRSLSGKRNLCLLKTCQQEQDLARANTSTMWDTLVYCDILLINLLCILISKTLDSQAAFGKGLVDSGTQAINNNFTSGVHNTKGLFYGKSIGTASNTATAIKIFGMENYWGFLWHRFAGLNNVEGTIKYKMTRSTADGSTASDYVISTTASDYSGYLTAGSTPATAGTYVKKNTYNGNMFYPTEVGATDSTYYTDGIWTTNTQTNYGSFGGACTAAGFGGIFACSYNSLATNNNWARGTRISCKPLAPT